MLEDILKGIGLSNLEISTYTRLSLDGASTASKLAKLIRIPRSSIYQVLKNLIAKGFVIETQIYSNELKSNLKVFYAVDTANINLIIQKDIERMTHLKSKLKTVESVMSKKDINYLISPKFQIFYGEDKVQSILNDMLLYDNIQTFAFWPISDMIDVLGESFFRTLNKIRIRNNLYTRAIWSTEKSVDILKYPFLGSSESFKREIRIFSGKLNFSMGFWSYANKVAFLSSKKEGFGFIVESVELVEMLRSMFDIIWPMSEPIETESIETKKFLSELNDLRNLI
jgi:predicted transcriptional regulator